MLRAFAFPNISDVEFAWFHESCHSSTSLRPGARFEAANGNKACAGDVRWTRMSAPQVDIKFTRREPAARLTGADEGKLLVAMFAWDGNAYVGNEYWQGYLSASGSADECAVSTVTLCRRSGSGLLLDHPGDAQS